MKYGAWLLVLLFLLPRPSEGSCTSEWGCTDCFQDLDTQQASCSTVFYDSFCTCTVGIRNPFVCTLNQACEYTGSNGGGGTGGGGGGGGGGGCFISYGQWCPPDCVVCTPVYWY